MWLSKQEHRTGREGHRPEAASHGEGVVLQETRKLVLIAVEIGLAEDRSGEEGAEAHLIMRIG